MLRPDKYSAKPWRELLVPRQIVRAQRTHPKKFFAGESDQRERQVPGLQVRAKLGAPSLERLVAENVAIVLERFLRQRRNKLRMMRQVVDLQCLTRLRSDAASGSNMPFSQDQLRLGRASVNRCGLIMQGLEQTGINVSGV